MMCDYLLLYFFKFCFNIKSVLYCIVDLPFITNNLSVFVLLGELNVFVQIFVTF